MKDYGKVSKKKKVIKEKLKSIFTGAKPESEQEEEKDRTEAQRIHNQEEGEGRQVQEREVEQEEDAMTFLITPIPLEHPLMTC